MKIDLTGLENVLPPKKDVDPTMSLVELMRKYNEALLLKRKKELNRLYGKL